MANKKFHANKTFKIVPTKAHKTHNTPQSWHVLLQLLCLEFQADPPTPVSLASALYHGDYAAFFCMCSCNCDNVP